MNAKISIIFFVIMGLTGCVNNASTTSSPLFVPVTYYPEPVMSEFYRECMKSGGTPTSESGLNVQVYKGPEQLFSLYTPHVSARNSSAIIVDYLNMLPAPPSTPKFKYIKRKLLPGQAAIFSTTEIRISKRPRGNPDFGLEMCIKKLN